MRVGSGSDGLCRTVRPAASRGGAQLSGVQRFHPHALRRTLACEWVDRGGSLSALQQLLGRSPITVTQRCGRISDSMVRAELRRLASVAGAVASGEDPGRESVGWLMDGGVAKW
jgi:integrase